jgi:DNA repair exonuclease SbcCD ATPase subunit
MTPLRTRLVAAALGAGLIIALPATALAAPGDRTRIPAAERTRDSQALKDRCRAAIDKRLAALEAASNRLAGAKHVTDEHEAALAGIIDDSRASLEALAGQIDADTEAEALKAHCRSIFVDHRVFALVLPRTRLVVASDTAVAAADRLEQAADRIEQAIAKAEAAGQDVTQAKVDLETMRADIDSARTEAAGVPDGILGLTPADWNTDHEVLAPAREALRSARADLKAARDLARGIVAGLRA